MKEAEKERQAVVAWLRAEAVIWTRYYEHSMASALSRAADHIERGDHLREQDNEG